MDAIHREICKLIFSRRKALTLQQIQASVVGYGLSLIELNVKAMVEEGWLVSQKDKKDTIYMLTLKAFNEVKEG